MAFEKGNQFWKNVPYEKIGRPPKYKTPNELWEDVKAYFIECDENPMSKQEITTTDKGTFDKEFIYKVPYTWQGLYVFLSVKDLDHYKTKDEFSEILSHISNIIYNQKFTGASVNIFNANIIARDLGLADKKDVRTEDTKTDLSNLSEDEILQLSNLQKKAKT